MQVLQQVREVWIESRISLYLVPAPRISWKMWLEFSSKFWVCLGPLLLLSCLDNYATPHRVDGENNFIDRVARQSCRHEYNFAEFQSGNPCDLPKLQVEYPALDLTSATCGMKVSKDSTSTAPDIIKFANARPVSTVWHSVVCISRPRRGGALRTPIGGSTRMLGRLGYHWVADTHLWRRPHCKHFWFIDVNRALINVTQKIYVSPAINLD